jgi:hypothetical protein
MEMIVQLRVASILHLAVVIPMRWLAGNTHKLSEYGWGERSRGRAITFLHDAFVDVQGDGALMLDENFIMNIFSPLYEEISPLKEYLDYHFEEKEGNVMDLINRWSMCWQSIRQWPSCSFPRKWKTTRQHSSAKS